MAPLRRRLHLFPSWEVLPFENLSPHPENIAGRLEGLYKLIEEPAPILIATPAALMQRVIPKEALKKSYLYIVVGQDLPREGLLEHLIHWGFQNVPLVEERGDFSVRGGIVDLFSPGYAPADCVLNSTATAWNRFASSIRPTSAPTAAAGRIAYLLPMKEFSLKGAGIGRTRRRLDQRALELEVDRREKQSLLESLREGIPVPGIEFLLPLFLSRRWCRCFPICRRDTLGLARRRRPRGSRKPSASAGMAWERNRHGQRRTPPGGAGGSALLKRA